MRVRNCMLRGRVREIGMKPGDSADAGRTPQKDRTMIFRTVLLALLALPLLAQDSTPTKWNVVLILADDLGWRDLGCTGSTFYETPALDRLASQGMKFTQAYSACNV